MALKRKRACLLALMLFAIGLLLFLPGGEDHGAKKSDVAISFKGFTNLPGSNRRFALLSIVNNSNYDVRWHGDFVQVEGLQDRRARLASPMLPGATYEPVLKVGESMTMAVGEPSDVTENRNWRFVMLFTRYSAKERWLDFKRTHKVPSSITRLVPIDTQQLFDPTNFVTAESEWFKK